MIKICGMILLLFGATWVGMSASKKLDMRVKTLRSILECLELFEWELTTNVPLTNQLFADVSKRVSQPASLFLNACLQNMRANEYIMSEVWERAAQKQLTSLNYDDLEAVLSLGAVLGRYDTDSQKHSIMAAHQRLCGNLNNAIDEKKRLGRLYRTLGVMAGAFLVIIFL